MSKLGESLAIQNWENEESESVNASHCRTSLHIAHIRAKGFLKLVNTQCTKFKLVRSEKPADTDRATTRTDNTVSQVVSLQTNLEEVDHRAVPRSSISIP